MSSGGLIARQIVLSRAELSGGAARRWTKFTGLSLPKRSEQRSGGGITDDGEHSSKCYEVPHAHAVIWATLSENVCLLCKRAYMEA